MKLTLAIQATVVYTFPVCFKSGVYHLYWEPTEWIIPSPLIVICHLIYKQIIVTFCTFLEIDCIIIYVSASRYSVLVKVSLKQTHTQTHMCAQNTHFYFLSFHVLGIQVKWVLCSRSHRLKLRCQLDHKLIWGLGTSSKLIWLWQDLLSWGRRTEVPISFMVVSWSPLAVLRGTWPPPSSESAMENLPHVIFLSDFESHRKGPSPSHFCKNRDKHT